MTTEDLQGYVSNQIAQGVNPEVLRMALDAEGISQAEIEEAIKNASSEGFATSGGETTPKFSVPAEPVAVAATPVPRKFSGKTFGIAASVVLVLILAGAGVYGYEYMNNTPEKITERFLSNYDSVKSVDYSGSLNFEATGALSGVYSDQNFKGEVIFAGSSDMTDAAHPKSKTNIKFTGEGFNFDLDTIGVDRTAFLKVNEFPALSFFDAGKVKDKWIKVDPQALAAQYDASGEVRASMETTSQVINIRELLAKNKVLKLTNKLPSETLDNVSTYHYGFEIDKAQFKQFMLEAIKSSAAAADSKELESGIDKFWQTAEVSDGQIWLGKKDYLPRKISMKVRVNNPDSGTAIINMILTSGNYNKPVEILAPDSTTDLQNIFEELELEPNSLE